MNEGTWFRRHGSTIRWYVPRILALLLIVGLIWFFFFRPTSPEAETPTSGKTSSSKSSESKDGTQQSNDAKRKDEGNKSASESSDTSSGEGLPDTGPADMLAIFVATAFAGTLLWELHLRLAGQAANSDDKPRR